MSAPVQVLVVDDDAPIRLAWRRSLERNGFVVHTAADAADAIAQLTRQHVDVVVTDVHMPGMSGLELLAHIKAEHPDLEVLMLTGLAHYEGAVEAGRAGAFAYLRKNEDFQVYAAELRNAARVTRLTRENRRLRARMTDPFASRSAAMRPVRRMLERFAPTDHSILILGPNGVGKSMLAREIHAQSARARRPFLVLDGGQHAPGVWDSRISGHVRGAFTGATESRPGIFEQADGGTVFLDEIGDIPLAQQSALLRVLQERKVQRIGTGRDITVDFRLISATNRDIQQMIDEGSFRRDLYHRLKFEEVRLPALSERPDDLPDLVQRFLARTDSRRISPAAMAALTRYPWPGNVRELETAIMRAGVLAAGGVIEITHLPDDVAGSRAPAAAPPVGIDCSQPWRSAIDAAESAIRAHYLRTLLERFDGNLSQAARTAGLDRANFRRYVRRYLPDWKRPR